MPTKSPLKLTSHLEQHPSNVHEIFAQHALLQPDSVALIWKGKSITYSELNSAANDGAAALLRLGVAAGSYVPILMERGPELIISLLAVLKTGGAYSLLDPSWPDERLLDVIKLLKPPLMITKDLLPPGITLPVWSPSTNRAAVIKEHKPIRTDRNEPCCVFFTSGTTGQPKGVISPHRATVRLFRNNTFLPFSSHTVIPLAAALAWDAFSLELWGALLNGGTSWILEESYLSADMLRIGIKQNNVNTVWLTSSLFNMVVEEDLGAFAGLHYLMIGGERLSVSHVKKFLCQHPSITLINGYGPVESTIFATTHQITLDDCERLDGIPLGSPVSGTEVYVLNNQQVCKQGEEGEICIGGEGLALRYLGDSILTNEKFVDVEIGNLSTKVYRTGDIGFWDNGLLYFKGRIDRLVKIRGHRVELADVENQIKSILPEVRSCRVLVRRDMTNISYELIAFCIPRTTGDKLENALKLLRPKLAAYQCPAVVVAVKEFPLTAQGKLNEKALLDMLILQHPKTSLQRSEKYDEPLLEIVAETFCDVLNRKSVPLDISFLELGGTSLDGGRICMRIAKHLGCSIPMSSLYQFPTVSALTRQLKESNLLIQPIQVNTYSQEIPLNPMQLIYLTRHLANFEDRTSLCRMVWIIEGKLNQKSLEAGIRYAHQRHDSLRAVYIPDPKPVVKLINIAPPILEVFPSQPSLQVALDTLSKEVNQLEPTEGDIWRTALIPLQENETFVFGCVVHHIAFDGWSEKLLADDISVGYNAACGTGVPSLPPASLASAHAASAQLLSNQNVSAQDSFLISELVGVPEFVWPNSQVNYSLSDQPAEEISVFLSRDQIIKIDSLAVSIGRTRFEILFAHWSYALSKVTGQDDFCIGVPVRLRSAPELEYVLGCYINMVCLRMRGKAIVGDLEAIFEVSRIIQRAFAAQEVPLERVMELIHLQPTGRLPLFKTLFALQDNPTPQLYLNGLSATFIRQPYLDLPLDLHAEIWPEDNGGLRLVISRRPERVSACIVSQLAETFLNNLNCFLKA